MVIVSDLTGSATSPFHTHCLAIDGSSQDHTHMINYHANEIEKLMNGVDMHCGVSGADNWVQTYLEAYICNCVKKSAVLKTDQMGTY